MTFSRPAQLSVVIAAWNGPEMLASCLSSLAAQVDAARTEVIVVGNYDCPADMQRRFPFARFSREPDFTIVPELRSRGVSLAAGRIVAILEDHCTVGEHWCAEIAESHELPYSVIGGSVENRPDQKPLDWAVYFYDYGNYMLPDTARVVPSLSGANVSYKREVLEEINQIFADGFYETTVNDELRKRGHLLYFAPSAVIHHNKEYSLRPAMAEAYHHAKTFAGRRVANAVPIKRLAYAVASIALPVLLPLRTVTRVLRKRRNRKALGMSLPYLLLLLAGWSCGEFAGYLFGEGKSAEVWR